MDLLPFVGPAETTVSDPEGSRKILKPLSFCKAFQPAFLPSRPNPWVRSD